MLYSGSTVHIINGCQLSNEIEVGRGIHQGCPLSPALFALVMELLVQKRCSDPHIKGIVIGNADSSLEKKLNLFADDLLGFLQHNNQSLKGFLYTIDSFGQISGLKLNYQKSQIIPIGSKGISALPVTKDMQWLQVDQFDTLSITVTTSLEQMEELNYRPRVKAMESSFNIYGDQWGSHWWDEV